MPTDPALGILRRNNRCLMTVLDTSPHLSRSCLRRLPQQLRLDHRQKAAIPLPPRFSHNAMPRGRTLNVAFRQELTLKSRHRNDGLVPTMVIRHSPLQLGDLLRTQ